jgi:uncharacterized protein YidB (DUF937 family)
MGMFDDAVPGGNISKPIMIALGALLAGKLLGGFGGGDAAAPAPTPDQPDRSNDNSIGGGLGDLLKKLGTSGNQKTVDSWVRPGENEPIAPGQLQESLGSTTISDLARKAGVSESELLEQLSRVLPGVVDKLTPQGQVPHQNQVDDFFRRAVSS